jgi:HEAT repeat protein
MGSAAAAAVTKIQPHLASHNTAVQYQAFSAIGEIKGAPDGKLPQALSKGSIDGLQVEEQYGVLKSSRNKPESRTLLLNATEDKRPYIQAMGLQSLAAVGKSDKAAVQAILARIASPDEFISSTAAEALGGIDAGNAALVDVLTEGLAHPNRTVRYSAAQALKRFGVAAKTALPALIAALRKVDQAEGVFGAYLEVLRNLGPAAKEAAPVILDLLPERSVIYRNRDKFTAHYLRAFMLLTLTEIGVLEQAGPFILDGLANGQGHLYAAAAGAAAKSPQLWQQAVPLLIRALQPDFPDHFLTFERFFARFSSDEKYTSAKIEAIRALGQMGPTAKDASAQLAKIAAERPEFMGDASLIADEATKALRAVGN